MNALKWNHRPPKRIGLGARYRSWGARVPGLNLEIVRIGDDRQASRYRVAVRSKFGFVHAQLTGFCSSIKVAKDLALELRNLYARHV